MGAILNDYHQFIAKHRPHTSYNIPLDKVEAADKFEAEMTKHFLGPFNAAREKLAKEIDTLKSGLASVQKSLAQEGAQIAPQNFGFDPKKPDDKKKIERAQVMYKKFFSDAKRQIDAEMRALAELEKHVVFIKRHAWRHHR